ncbi:MULTISPECIES: MaoC/PaaZ C-terminal domain-containing protein [Staphylococcus]|uniref:MaoC/PaaZ C-terminal domain-containing protein n=1 Tax=Staphylococcus hsinchuensis TaxID=3051183 RepID=A0ABZ3EEZ5_9STAP|nr:MaoC/PaaZ C-terminal domain-containing protein [Staphylococcus sp. Marseille-Q5304]
MKFDAFNVGDTFKTNTYHITEEDIMQFATFYDPQYMHIDKEKAEQGQFGGIIASGFQTLSLSFKLWVETENYGEDIIAGTRMDNVKFTKPVFPNDTIYVVVEVIDKKSTKKESGLLTIRMSTYNHHDQLVFKGDLATIIAK